MTTVWYGVDTGAVFRGRGRGRGRERSDGGGTMGWSRTTAARFGGGAAGQGSGSPGAFSSTSRRVTCNILPRIYRNGGGLSTAAAVPEPGGH
jgi:hypothetical protein